MGLFREPGSGGAFITSPEKQTLAEQEVRFQVTGVAFRPGGGYKGSDGYAVYLLLDDEERTLTFGAGDVRTRDEDLDGVIEYFKEGGVPFEAFITKRGQAYFIQDADE